MTREQMIEELLDRVYEMEPHELETNLRVLLRHVYSHFSDKELEEELNDD